MLRSYEQFACYKQEYKESSIADLGASGTVREFAWLLETSRDFHIIDMFSE